MTVEENLRLVDVWLEAFNDHDLDRMTEFIAESCVWYQPSRTEPLRGRAAILEDLGFRGPFPDVQFHKERAFGQGDWICIQATLTGTHKGPLIVSEGSEIPPTNKQFRLPVCIVGKVEAGKAIEVYEYLDQLGLLAQLDISP